MATGQPILPRADRIRYEAVAADLKQHYEATGSRDLKEYARRVAHLERCFAGRRVASIGQPDVDAYIVQRQEQGAVGSTIRRELGTLATMLRLAYENGKLLRLPILHKPKEARPAKAFSSETSTTPCAGGSPRICRRPSRSPKRSAGGCRARC